jgi:DNA-binding transcriptional LysR family regulator
VALEVNDVHSLLELVHEGLGIAVVPRHFGHKPEARDLTALPFKGASEGSYETVAMLPPAEATSPAARALMTLLDASQEGA